MSNLSFKMKAKFVIFQLVYILLAVKFTTTNESPAMTPSKGNSSSSIEYINSPEEDEEEEKVSPYDAELLNKTTIVFENTCIVFFENCWSFLKSRKPSYSPEQRVQICSKRMFGYEICQTLSGDRTEEAKEDADKNYEAAAAAKKRIQEKAADRKTKLAKRKKAVQAKWIAVKEQRRDKSQSTTTTTGPII